MQGPSLRHWRMESPPGYVYFPDFNNKSLFSTTYSSIHCFKVRRIFKLRVECKHDM